MNLKSQKVMSSTKNIQTEPHGSKRQLKKQVDRRLRFLIHGDAEAIILDLARELAVVPPLFRDKKPSIPEEFGWFFPIGDVRARLYQRLFPVAMGRADRVAEEFRLHRRPDYATWQRWLEKRARFWAAKNTTAAHVYVAEQMATIFSERYGVRIVYYCADGAAVFYIPGVANLGEGWVLLRDTLVRGETPADKDYLRVIYAYHPERQLLLRLHHRHIHIPIGRWACRWIISGVWENIARPEANIIAGCC